MNSDLEPFQSPHDQLLRDVESRQRNTLWPDTVVNGSTVDGLLWKGSPQATKVQRIGIAVFGFFFFSFGVLFLSEAFEDRSTFLTVFSFLWLGLGTKITMNAFKRKPARS